MKQTRPHIWLALCAVIPLSACLGGLWPFGEGPRTDYTLAISDGVGDEDLRAYLQKIMEERLARDFTEDDDPDQRARQEIYREHMIRADLLKALEAKGYYDGAVIFEDQEGDYRGQFRIEPGAAYRIDKVNVEPARFADFLGDDAPRAGDVLDAQRTLDAQNALARAAQKGRCYFTFDVRNAVTLDQATQRATLNYIVDAGRQATFGPTMFEGNESVRASYLRRMVPWKEGECFRREKLEAYKNTLLKTGLFGRADAVLPDAPDKDGSVPVTVRVGERAHRSLRAGGSYYSDEGVGVTLGWEHRNYLGAGEKLAASLNLSSLRQVLDLEFIKPYFMRDNQILSANASLRRQETDAFDELGIDAGINIQRRLSRRWTFSTGIQAALTQIEDMYERSKRLYGLVSFPQKLGYDSRDDALDPHRGILLSAIAEPFLDIMGESDPFFKLHATGSTYFDLGTDANVVLALKGGVGSLWGAEEHDIPATKRFYAGGGGSVRGFGYQEVGPQRSGKPMGGMSIVNFSVELRTRPFGPFGGVVFLDGASVSDESTPQFNNMALGTGVGVRYFTDFGPIRFDVATPLSEKNDLERNYQFYISIGQAF